MSELRSGADVIRYNRDTKGCVGGHISIYIGWHISIYFDMSVDKHVSVDKSDIVGRITQRIRVGLSRHTMNCEHMVCHD